ncbi:hypothetical protein BCR33DRAFT_718743 [Rhizoclosmatium globosum]|uniref:Alpha/beta-hydrolase n=1 Tax=Rhizoclosmatium globosum TaxID=329046 RepID=A0A1Y2C3G7_9FUNG|nr:hypothetical protein BCR33DRAFT_718743 [Rhizoclosmatium globosum]|eukprot:ORY41582.1 hypothetical protein BCR33DRAFT_718743 [Rhizoclosmatium globosum]
MFAKSPQRHFEVSVSFPQGTKEVYGTLTCPYPQIQPVPLVAILLPSPNPVSPSDPTQSHKLLSHHLADNNVTTIRWNKDQLESHTLGEYVDQVVSALKWVYETSTSSLFLSPYPNFILVGTDECSYAMGPVFQALKAVGLKRLVSGIIYIGGFGETLSNAEWDALLADPKNDGLAVVKSGGLLGRNVPLGWYKEMKDESVLKGCADIDCRVLVAGGALDAKHDTAKQCTKARVREVLPKADKVDLCVIPKMNEHLRDVSGTLSGSTLSEGLAEILTEWLANVVQEE